MRETTYFKALCLLLIAALLSSYAHAMEFIVDEDSDKKPVTTTAESSNKKEESGASSEEKKIILDFQNEKKLITKIPRSIKYLIAYSPFFTDTPIHSDIDPDINWKSIVDGGPKARQAFFTKCAAYQNSKRYYDRAERAHKSAQNEKTSQELTEKRDAFEEIQLWFLLKFSPLTKLIELNKNKIKIREIKNEYDVTVEIFKYTVDPEDFKEEIEEIKKIVCRPRGGEEFKSTPKPKIEGKSILKTVKKPLKEPGFPLESQQLPAEQKIMKRFRSILEREDDILHEVCEPYNAYTLEVTGLYPRKTVNWLYDTPRPETEEEIQTTVNEKYPSGPLTLRFLNQPIDFMSDSDLLLYATKGCLYFKLNNKDIMEIKKSENNKTYGTNGGKREPCLGGNVYKRVLEALSATVPQLSLPDQSHLLNFAFLSEYCLDDSYNPCVQATLMAMGKAREVWEKLGGRIKWSERTNSKSFIEVEPSADTMDTLEARYNNLKKYVDESEEEKEQEILKRKDSIYLYENKKTLEEARTDCFETPYPKLPPYRTLYCHRSKMVDVLKDLQDLRKDPCPEGQNDPKPYYQYNTKELEAYLKDYNELKPLLIEHLKFVQSLASDVGYKVSGALSAYQTETYREETLPEELNLARSKLGDESFFYGERHFPPEEGQSLTEQKNQRLRLLFSNPTQKDLDSIQKGESGLYNRTSYEWPWPWLCCKVYDNVELQIAKSDEDGCSSETYDRLVKAMSCVPTNVQQLVSVRDKLALFQYTAEIGYTQKKSLLERFEKVNFFGNQLTGKEKLTFCPNLRKLDLGQNHLTSTESLRDLRRLETLDARDNLIDSLSGLETCTALTYLNIERRDFRASVENTTNELKNLNAFSQFQHLTYLNLARHSLKTTGFLDVTNLKTLTDLDVSYNNFKTMDYMTHLVNLTKLNISHNELKTLRAFMYLKSLKKVQATHNELQGSLMNYFSPVKGRLHLTDLQSLDVAYNYSLAFTSSPDEKLEKENYTLPE